MSRSRGISAAPDLSYRQADDELGPSPRRFAPGLDLPELDGPLRQREVEPEAPLRPGQALLGSSIAAREVLPGEAVAREVPAKAVRVAGTTMAVVP